MAGSRSPATRQRTVAVASPRPVEVFRWTGTGYHKASGHIVAGDVVVRRGPHGRVEVDEVRDAGQPQLTVPAHRVVVVDLIRRIRAGEFRYRLPDGVVHEQPFPSYTELTQQYKTGWRTVSNARKELGRLGWIVPGDRPGVRWRLAARVPPVNRSTHPASAKRPRARELADDLIARILAGEFTDRRFVGLVEATIEYRVGHDAVGAAFDILEQERWIDFRHNGWGRMPVLADPLPEPPDTIKPMIRPAFTITKRAWQLAGDLIARILAGEFDNRRFPGLRDVMAEHGVGQVVAQAAFGELERQGWIEFHCHRNRRGRIARLRRALG